MVTMEKQRKISTNWTDLELDVSDKTNKSWIEYKALTKFLAYIVRSCSKRNWEYQKLEKVLNSDLKIHQGAWDTKA